MTRYHLINGERVVFTAEEEAARDKEEAAVAIEQAANTEATKLETNHAVKRKRRREYNSLGDQLDLLYKDIVAGKLDTNGEWAKHIKAVKEANPKS